MAKGGEKCGLVLVACMCRCKVAFHLHTRLADRMAGLMIGTVCKADEVLEL